MNSDPRLHSYYETRFAEADRLSTREGQLEKVRTKEILERHLPKSPAMVIDIGGGTGVYASWLASLNHNVHLVDVVSAHVEEAAKVGTFTCALGDARRLEDADNKYDVVLLLGPMYHLLEPDDRLAALKEARRVLKSGGVMAVAYISRLGVALDAFVKGWIYEGHGARGVDAMEHVVGQGSDPGGGGFGPIAYFHLPTEIRPELESADLEVTGIFGVEGPGWIDADFEGRWQKQQEHDVILDTARICESVPEMQGISPHILAIARKP